MQGEIEKQHKYGDDGREVEGKDCGVNPRQAHLAQICHIKRIGDCGACRHQDSLDIADAACIQETQHPRHAEDQTHASVKRQLLPKEQPAVDADQQRIEKMDRGGRSHTDIGVGAVQENGGQCRAQYTDQQHSRFFVFDQFHGQPSPADHHP